MRFWVSQQSWTACYEQPLRFASGRAPARRSRRARRRGRRLRHARGPVAARRPDALLRPQVADDRTVPRRPRQRRQRRARTTDHVLLRVGRRRRLEDDQRRPHLDAGLRLAAGRLDRRHRRRALQPERRLRRDRRGRHAVADLVRQRRLQVDRCRPDLDAPGPRRHAPDRARHGRSAEPRRRVRRGARARLRPEPGAGRVPLAGRRGDLAEGPLPERQRRRRGPGDRPEGPEDRVRVALEHAASAVVDLRAVLRPGQRPLQVG